MTPEYSTQYIYGKNPVIEALTAEVAVEKIFVLQSVNPSKLGALYGLAKKQRVPVVTASKDKFVKMGLKDESHQGIVAMVSPIRFLDLQTFLLNDHQPSPIVILDGIEDPHNLGAIIRSAEVLGVGAVLLPIRNSSPLSATVVKASAGAVFHVPIIKVTNINQSLEILKKRGYWIYGMEADGTIEVGAATLNTPTCIIIGSEGKGLRPIIRDECDQILRIDQSGKVNSLNASVSAGIIFWEVWKNNRQSI